jgi:hypothetical protein
MIAGRHSVSTVLATFLMTFLATLMTFLATLPATLIALIPKLAMLLATTVPALAVTKAKTAFVEAWTVPAVDVETNRGIFDRCDFDRRSGGGTTKRNGLRAPGHQRPCRQHDRRRADC